MIVHAINSVNRSAKYGYGVFNRSVWTIFATRGFSRGPSRFPHFAQKRLSSGMCDPQYLQNITPTLSADKTPAPSPHANPAAAWNRKANGLTAEDSSESTRC